MSLTRSWTNTAIRWRPLQSDQVGAGSPRWLTYEQVIALHARQLRKFGGAAGLRDEGMLHSALDRPLNKWRYEQSALPELAAAYAFGLAKNHAFVDGNKRVAFMAAYVFLGINGHELELDEADAATTIERAADGRVSEPALADWLRQHLKRLD